jgi:predicted transcriptional regulator
MRKEITPVEFDIVKLLWKCKRLSSREIHEMIVKKNDWTYSTTRTVIDRMVKKGYLSKENFHGIYIYGAKVSKVKLLARQVSQFAEKILETDPLALLPLFAKSEILTEEELDKLKALLKEKEAKK